MRISSGVRESSIRFRSVYKYHSKIVDDFHKVYYDYLHVPLAYFFVQSGSAEISIIGRKDEKMLGH